MIPRAQRRSLAGRLATALALALTALALTALATATPAAGEGLINPGDMPGPLKEVGFDQRLGDKLPLDAPFVDEEGRQVTLGDFFGKKPVVVAFVYYSCPMLCTLIMEEVAKSLGVIEFDAGDEFEVVAISFKPGETPLQAREAEARAVERYGRPTTADGWHFLTGGEASIRRATEAAGFRYAYVPESGEYAHASGIIVATPDGTLAQYFYGLEYPARDVRLALVEASDNRIGSVVDQLLLYCFHYDPSLGRYTATITRIVRLGGVVTCLGLAVFLWTMWRREKAAVRRQTSNSGAA